MSSRIGVMASRCSVRSACICCCCSAVSPRACAARGPKPPWPPWPRNPRPPPGPPWAKAAGASSIVTRVARSAIFRVLCFMVFSVSPRPVGVEHNSIQPACQKCDLVITMWKEESYSKDHVIFSSSKKNPDSNRCRTCTSTLPIRQLHSHDDVMTAKRLPIDRVSYEGDRDRLMADVPEAVASGLAPELRGD